MLPGRRSAEYGLELRDGVDRTRIDVVVERQVRARPVAEVDEVEELREPTFPASLDLEDLHDGFVDERARGRGAVEQTRVCEPVLELDEREHLTRHVAVLTPATDLVVIEL